MRRRALAGIAALSLAGCQQTVTPPARVADPAVVYITDHGRHAGIVLPSDGGSTEWFWGDWHYFALRERSVWSGLRALFASPQAALGRFDMAATGAEAIRRKSGAESLVAISVERGDAVRLQAELSRQYVRHAETEIVDADGARFVHHDGHYWLLHNSNDKVCDWLRQLGASADCPAVVANFVVRASAQR